MGVEEEMMLYTKLCRRSEEVDLPSHNPTNPKKVIQSWHLQLALISHRRDLSRMLAATISRSTSPNSTVQQLIPHHPLFPPNISNGEETYVKIPQTPHSKLTPHPRKIPYHRCASAQHGHDWLLPNLDPSTNFPTFEYVEVRSGG
ncbi:hypothetical protein PV10_06437 [Exophiala mesophila]|uniref:Uncharacterized protein n=1 Tax=Exophiala mesophila TaxID=212818 RepID=A0A0D1XUR0_EXOME|nr:uncharacterized protein PV10_06437 [Exophiala mesophila]KIV91951.1 hypothetical protein PV10_06437 [Exophiala mesophila]